jgi:hypothetical protein
MTIDDPQNEMQGLLQEAAQDRAWPVRVRWDLGPVRTHSGEMLWRCDALRAGQLYRREVFPTQREAERFAARMQSAEPDKMFRVEAIKASSVWN